MTITARSSPGPAARALREHIESGLPDDIELSEREEVFVDLAGQQLDRVAELEAVVDRDGVMVLGSAGQQRCHPGIGEARQAALAAARLLSMLALPDGAAAVPRTASQVRGAHAANARWAQRRGAA